MSDKYNSKFKRMLAILKIIENKDKYNEVNHNINRKNLAKLLGVSPRTIGRYIKHLKDELGLPIIYNDETKNYEYYDKSVRSLKSNEKLNITEILLMLMILDSSRSFNGIEVINLKEKLLSLLPDEFKTNLERLRHQMGYTSLEEKKGDLFFIEKIQKAILDEKTIHLKYEPAYKENPIMEREIIPYGVAWDNNKGYLIGLDIDDDNIINYRLDRIKNIQVTKKEGSIPESFNLSEYVSKSWKMFHGELFEIELKVNNNLKPLFKDKFDSDYYEIQENNDDTFVFKTEIRGIEIFKNWILGLGDQVKVLKPDTLKSSIVEEAQKIMNLYQN